MELLRKLESILPEAEESLLLELLEGGFIFDTFIDGEKIGVRRVSDTPQDEGVVRTEFFLFPQNGKKDKLKKGAFAVIESEVCDGDEGRHAFANPRFGGSRKGAMTDVYYAVAASTGGRQIAQDGGNTYLDYDLLVVTPERNRVAIEEFDFGANKMFMLGLYGGDYKIEIKNR